MLTCHQALFMSCMDKIADDEKCPLLYIPTEKEAKNKTKQKKGSLRAVRE